MNLVTIELWLWLGKEIGEDFETLSEMRSIKKERVKPGTTIQQLLEMLANCYPSLAYKIFDSERRTLNPYFVINYNDKVISPYIIYDQILQDGDKITILPLYVGG